MPALYVLSALFLLAGLLNGLLVRQPAAVDRPRRIHGTALVALSAILAVAALDAGAAFLEHGPAMRQTALVLLTSGGVCVVLVGVYLYVFFLRRGGHGEMGGGAG